MVLASVHTRLGGSVTAALIALPVVIPITYLIHLDGRICGSNDIAYWAAQ